MVPTTVYAVYKAARIRNSIQLLPVRLVQNYCNIFLAILLPSLELHVPPFPSSIHLPTMSHEEGISVKDTNNSSSSNDDYETGHFGPLAHVNTASSRYPAFGGDLQPGLYRVPKDRKLANPAPLGLCAFALTTFVLGCLNMNVRGIAAPNIIVGPALAYGGFVQLLAGMWYVA